MTHNAIWIFFNILKTLFICVLYIIVFGVMIARGVIFGFADIVHDWFNEIKDDLARVWDLD